MKEETMKELEPKKNGGAGLDPKVLLALLAILFLLIMIGLPPILRIMDSSEEEAPVVTPTPTPTNEPSLPIETDAPTNVTGSGMLTCTFYTEQNSISITDEIDFYYNRARVYAVEQNTNYRIINNGNASLLDSIRSDCDTKYASYSDFEGVDIICDGSEMNALHVNLVVSFDDFFEEDLAAHDPPIVLEFSSGADINDVIIDYTGKGYTCVLG